jgi:hypothetical protein
VPTEDDELEFIKAENVDLEFERRK